MPRHSCLRSQSIGLVCALCALGCGDTSPSVRSAGEGGTSASSSSSSGDAAGAGTSIGGATSFGGSIATGDRSAVAGANVGTGLKTTPNLFVTLLGKTSAEVDAKVTTAVHRYFGIGTGESATPTLSEGYRCYYELPQDPTMAFIWAADSNDIRSEGMSYGMMIAVEANLQTEFDRLWRFTRQYMQYPGDTATSTWKYYFRWTGTVDFSGSSTWSVSFNPTEVPAPDGDQYFAAALYLADKRWGSSGDINYKEAADNIATAMLHNVPTAGDDRYPVISTEHHMPVFVPSGRYNGYTDPSYHLPAFYELFALYGPTVDRDQWRALAATSREFLVVSAHPTTGLHSDYATFAGEPVSIWPNDGHDKFQWDAWRVPMNMAIDYVWFSGDAKLKLQLAKYHAFFGQHLGSDNVNNSLFTVDGATAEGGGSTALTATLAAAALASGASDANAFVNALWAVRQESGDYRYYQEGVYLLGLLATAGKYAYAW